MTTADPPAVARRRVRLALRRAREAKGLTQGQVAEAMDWSLSKVMRIEGGDVGVSQNDLRVLLSHLGVTDSAEVEQLIQDSRAARRQRWTIDPRHREHLTSATLQLMQYEQEATTIRYYSPVVLPGLLQTEDYASAIFGYGLDIPESTIKVRIEARLQRRQRLLSRTGPSEYLIILDESVLYRDVGGQAVLAEQLLTVLQVMAETSILVRVLPFAAAAPVGLLGPFLILDMGDEQEAILYREKHSSDEIVRSRREINEHRDVFERLWRLALDDSASAKLIKQRADVSRAAAEAGPSG
jgi:transcriptional regulator with XRE-family HTH domain